MQKMDSYLGWKIDFENPPGAPAFCGPDSVSWRVFKNPDLSPFAATMLRAMGALAERIAIPGAPPAQASRRLGLPGDFLYRIRRAQERLFAEWATPRDASAIAAE